MKCKLTGTEGAPINAHIIPQSFFEIDPNEKKPVKIVSNIKSTYPKRTPIGIYDKKIVTVEGERLFSPWDDYATKILLQERDKFKKIFIKGRLSGYTVPTYDYALLKLFALSVLWRASVSSHFFYRNVKIGPHEPVIREALLNSDPGKSDWFSVNFAIWSDSNAGPGMMDPFRTRFDNINYYIIYLSNYIMYIKVDKLKAEGSLRATQLHENTPLILVGRELSKSKEFPIMVKMARLHAK